MTFKINNTTLKCEQYSKQEHELIRTNIKYKQYLLHAKQQLVVNIIKYEIFKI